MRDERSEEDAPSNFIADEIAADLEAGRYTRPICTRFPPEPNGFMHIGHAKAASVGHGLAERFEGLFNLRMDDTNPSKEEQRFVDAMIHDLEWFLGHGLEGRVFHASDYFPRLYECAEKLIEKGLAYVESLTTEEIRDYRGDFHTPGRPSPYRDRSVEENLTLFREMRDGKHEPGTLVLRAKIDPAASNMNMRDPIVYRVMHQPHHRAGDWKIYPLYDFAHPLSDAFEGVTHSTCGKEFANHRPLYDWFLEALDFVEPPRQIEFAEISVSRTILSKRHMKVLVEDGHVAGWDDPRMPTMSGMRRRGCPASAIREFCSALGVSGASPGMVDRALMDHFVREALNKTASRVMGVPRPLKVVIENYPEGQTDDFQASNLPGDDSRGKRTVSFGHEIYIDRSDFMEEPPPKYHRLAPGREVRLRSAYIIKCTEVIKDPETGEVTELRATYDPDSKWVPGGKVRKVKGTIQWVNAAQAVPVQLRMYGELFTAEVDGYDGSAPITDYLEPDSLEVLDDAVVEPSIIGTEPGTVVQFERVGYFCVDPDSTDERLVLNRTVNLRDNRFRRIFK
ncbi:MAG: glutamine--tRNA ligase/YqeY domain fusion protein [Myxococcota bacterium]